MPVGEWHKRMQSMFPDEQCEIGFVSFSKLGKHEHRQTDVFLSNSSCLEVQHSYISCNDVGHRKEDWEKFGKTIIWLIDGNTSDVSIETLTDCNTIITFNEPWKFKSFLENNYEFILLECYNQVYKVKLNAIKYKTIKVSKSIEIKQIVECLQNNPENIWKLWEDDNYIPSQMIVHQKGAGNGKTYGIWKSILTNQNKDTFIIITKQHSARTVIYNELNEQAARHEYYFEDITHMTKVELPKHYVIKYSHKTSNRTCKVIIGTVDSYIYNLSKSSSDIPRDMFSNLLHTIIRNGCNKIDTNGKFKFAKEQLIQNRKAELWIDEVQDLNIDYFYAIQKIILQTGIDVNIVGDMLQSLEYKTNFMTEAMNINDMDDIVFIKPAPVNLNRRIQVKGMIETINSLVPFEKYNLPAIHIENYESLITPKEPSFEIIEEPIIRTEHDIEKMKIYIDTVLEKVNYEVNTNGYLPEDFMFIFPYMKNNSLASELETKLNEYWISKFEDTNYTDTITNSYWKSYNHDEFTSYAFLHKHEEGTVINLSDSERATRLVTIRTSKGDGRKVVFVLNCTEFVLKMFTNQEKNIVYESYLHVALTRAKHKVYFGLVHNGDDICKRFSCIDNKYIDINKISKYLQLSMVLNNSTNEDTQKLIHKLDGIGKSYMDTFFDNLKKKTDGINTCSEANDWKYHCMKHSITNFYALFRLIEYMQKEFPFNKKNDNYPQILVVIDKITNIDIIKCYVSDFYKVLRNLKPCDNLPFLPLCNISDKNIYSKYCDKIQRDMEGIKKMIKAQQWNELTVYQMFLLNYMIDMYINKQFTESTPTDLYDITHYYSMKEYNRVRVLIDESVKIKQIVSDCLQEIYSGSKSIIHWNIHKSNKFDGEDSNFVLTCGDYIFIGWNDENTYHLMIENDVSSINQHTFILKLIFERFILYNCKSEKDKNKFKNKNIVTYVLILKNSTYHKIDWTWDNECRDILIESLQNRIYKHYQINHTKLYHYLDYVKTKKNEHYGEKTDFKTPFGYLSNKLKNEKSPEYLISFFHELDRDWKLKKRKEIKEVTQNEDVFCSTLDERLDQAIKDFLGLNEEVDDDEF
jgi:hypothetical protein